MNEILLQSIVEKLEAIELLLKAESGGKTEPETDKQITEQLNVLSKEFKLMPIRFTEITAQIRSLAISIDHNTKQEAQPALTRVEHKHHLHKGIWLSVGLSVISILLLWGWLNTYKFAESLSVNDIKYRYLKIAGNKFVQKICFQTDSLYEIDKEGFKIKVEQAEENLLNHGELIHTADERIKKTQKANVSEK